MLHELYEDMDPNYRAAIFLARKKLLGGVESPTLLPESGLSARSLLDEKQLTKVTEIRERRLAAVLDRFERD